jgi:hypothetical protein
MVARLIDSRPVRWGFAVALGPLTGPLALRGIALYRRGDMMAAAGYACAIPSVWMILSALAVLPWK